MEPSGDETYVLLRLRDGRRVVARAADLAGARRLLQAAGVSGDRRLLEVPLGSLARAEGNGMVMHLLGPFLAGIVTLAGVGAMRAGIAELDPGPVMSGAMFLTAGLFGIGYLLRAITPGRAVVGADGVRVRRFASTRFVPYEAIRAVKATDTGVVLLTNDGGPIPLHTRSFVDDAPGTSAALADRLGEAIRTFRSERLDAVARRSFDREGRRVADWKEALGKLTPAGDYRRTALESEDIVRLAEDPSGPAERRLGAALALSARELSPALRERLDAAAATTANPRLRIALDKAIAGDLTDDDLEALEEAPPAAKAQARS